MLSSDNQNEAKVVHVACNLFDVMFRTTSWFANAECRMYPSLSTHPDVQTKLFIYKLELKHV